MQLLKLGCWQQKSAICPSQKNWEIGHGHHIGSWAHDRHAMRRSKKCKSVIPRVINAAEKAFSSISISSHHLQKDPQGHHNNIHNSFLFISFVQKLAYFASPPCIVISIKEGQKIPSYIVARNHQRIFRFPGNPLGEFWVSTSRVL